MQNDRIFRSSAILSAILASLCCITPVLAILAGLGGLASAFSFLEPLRPIFIIFTLVVLGIAFYNAYTPDRKEEKGCACDSGTATRHNEFLKSRAFLWIITLMAVLLITFPYYSATFFPKITKSEKVSPAQIMRVKLDIEGMTCAGCENTVNYILKSKEGVISVKASYKTGKALIEYDSKKISPNDIKKALEKKTAYTVTYIQNNK